MTAAIRKKAIAATRAGAIESVMWLRELGMPSPFLVSFASVAERDDQSITSYNLSMTRAQATWYVLIGILGLIPITCAVYFFFRGVFTLTLIFFIVSIFFTEVRILVGGRSKRDVLLVVHLLCAVPFSILLLFLAFVRDEFWIVESALFFLVAMVFSGGLLWYRGMRAAIAELTR